MNNLRHSAVSGVFWSGFASVITGLCQAALLILYARTIPPADYGLVTLTIVIVGFMLIYSDSGLSGVIIHSQDLTDRQLSTFFHFNCMLGLFLFAVLETTASLIVNFYDKPAMSPVLMTSLLLIPFTFSGRVSESILQKELHFRIINIIEIISAAVSLVTAVTMIILKCGLWSMIGSLLLGSLVRSILMIIFSLSVFRLSLHFSIKDFTSTQISFGLFQFGERTINYFSERFDQFLIGKLGTTAMLGAYSIAFNSLVSTLNKINPVIIKIVFPVFSKAQNEGERLKGYFFFSVRNLAIINGAILLGFFSVADTAVPLLFGSRWIESIFIFRILSIVILLRCIGNPAGLLANAKGNANRGFYWNLLFAFASIPGMIIGFYSFRANGVAIALLLLQITFFYPFYLVCIKSFIGGCFREYLKTAFLPLIPGIIASASVFFISVNNIILSTILRLSCFEIIYFSLLFIFCKKDMTIALSLIKDGINDMRIQKRNAVR